MKIHIDTQTIFYTDDAAYLDYRGRTMRAEDRTAEDFWAREGYADFRLPTVPDGWKQTATPVNMGDYWTWQVAEKTAEDIAEERASLIRQVQRASRAYVDEQVDPAGMLLVDRLVRAGNAKGIACDEWCKNLYLDSYNRQALIEVGMWGEGDPCDFSSHGSKPYTIPQLMMEV